MLVDPLVQVSRRISIGALLVAFLLLPLAATPGFASDVPADARKNFDKAREYLASGEKKNFRKAWTRMKKIRSACQRSIDYWAFYLDLGKALGKDDAALWAEIGKAEQANAGCPSYELLRARLATDPEEQQKHLEQAVTVAPASIPVKLELVDFLLGQDEEIDAEEIVDAILEAHPEHIGALVRKGNVQMSGEYFNAALEIAATALAKRPLPEMYDLKARAYLAINAAEGKDVLTKAHDAAAMAVKQRPDAAFVVTLARILEKQDKIPAARDLVAKHQAEAPSPLLAGLLGDYAFRTGDYGSAAKVFKGSAATSVTSALGYAVSLARLGRYKDCAAAIATYVAVAGTKGSETAAGLYASIGRMDDAARMLEGVKVDGPNWVELYVSARAGTPERIAAAAGEMAEEDSLAAEWYLLQFARALVAKGMGSNAAKTYRTLMRKAQAKAGKAKVATATPPTEAYEMQAKTGGYMRRVPAYFTSVCGHVFQPGRLETGGAATQVGGEMKLRLFLSIKGGDGACPADRVREWHFNSAAVKQGADIKLPDSGNWAPIKEDYLEGCAKLVAGEAAPALVAFDKALAGEPGWHRVKLLRAVALALSDPSQRGTAAAAALAAVADWPEDYGARELALAVAHWGGEDVTAAAEAYCVHHEAHRIRRLTEL